MKQVVYEVNLEVDRGIADEYKAWLIEHASKIIDLPGFLHVEIFEDEWNDLTSSYKKWCVQYRVQSQEHLDAYLSEHAVRMREEGVERFGNKFRASRRVLALDTALSAVAAPQ